MKTVCVVSDFHCGHRVGLTPPDYRSPGKLGKLQDEYWEFFAGETRRHGPYDVVIANGDLIDGKGERSGGCEQITTDRAAQAEMAVECLKAIPLRPGGKRVLVYGTDSHTGKDEDWERQIADKLDCKIGGHEWVKVAGVVFDCKHHIGSSVIVHGRHTATARERFWNLLWADVGNDPRANVIVRSHVHYFNFCGGPDWLALTTPALQGLGSNYGVRRCSGVVDFGFVTFNVEGKTFQWHSHICRAVAARSTITVV